MSPTRATLLEELLDAYRDALDVADRAGPVVAPRRSHRRVLRHLRRPWPTWYLRLLVRSHVERHVQHLVRTYATLALRRPSDEGVAWERGLVATFRESLPPVRRHRARVTAVLAVLLVAQLEAHWLPKSDNSATSGGSEILGSLSSLTKLDTKSIGDAVAAIFTAKPLALALASLLLAAAAYVVLRPVSPTFRLKRMVFHQRLEPHGGFRSAVTAGAGIRSGGIYELEAELAHELDVRPLRELPLDICASLLFLYLLVLLAGIYSWQGGQLGDSTEQTMGMVLTGLGLLRAATLGWIWWRRSRVWRSSRAPAPGPAAQTVPVPA